ncbi:MAG TPA: hypothetical protein EYP14_04025 [Planctomycetaceae bacterium]|nr:hypothetical protein [Planctomycetaceae bacterium]
MAAPTRTQVHLDTAMTNLSIAYRNANYIAEQIFPVVPVNHQSDKYFVFDKASWFRNEAGLRAPGTRGPEVEYSVSSATYSCTPISATKVVPDEIVDNADNPLRPRREAVEFATDKVLLYLENEVASLVFGDGVWSGSSTPGTNWSDSSADPLGDVEAAREAIVKAIGREPNVMVIGREVWTALKQHSQIQDRIKHTTLGVLTTQLAAQLFEVDRLLIGNAIITSTPEGQSATYSYVWGKNCWLGWVPPNPGLMSPAAGYILAWKNRRVYRFRREEELADVYRCEMHFDVVATSPDAGYLLKSVVS